jgi:3-hydroxy acid dehydrogenase/malonic semialdehyde reductase
VFEEMLMPASSIALVTGANSGIGLATSQALAAAGYQVILSGRRHAAVKEAAERIKGETLAVELDISDPASIDTLFERIPQAWRAVSVLVNNAGHDRGGRTKFHEMERGDIQSILETNLIGLVQVTHAVIQGMVERDAGHIVNIGSVQGFITYPRATIYTASKFGIRGFSECLRIDYFNTGIRVTEVMPGLVQSQFAENRWGDATKAEKFYDEFSSRLWPDDVAEAVLYAIAQPAHVDVGQIVLHPGGRY